MARYRYHSDIHKLLESAFERYHSLPHRTQDPVDLVHLYPDPKDQEVAGIFASVLAYGNVRTILSSVKKALEPLGKRPADFLREETIQPLWPNFRHRFTTGDDILILSHWIQGALRGSGSIEKFFCASSEFERGEKTESISSFVRRFTEQDIPRTLEKTRLQRERNLKYLFPLPDRGSACKRLNMYLRWMVRPNDGIDLGIWKKVGPERLFLPVDTHLLKTLRLLKWTRSKQASWNVVEEATERLRLYCPEDPVRYDFALCHLSMSGGKVTEGFK